MSVTFTGITTTQKILGTGQGSQNVVVLENGLGSNTLVIVRRAMCMMDPTEFLLTSVKTLITTYRGTFNSSQGGIIMLEKGYFDSTQTSDPFVRAWSSYVSDGLTGSGGITATNFSKQWHQFSPTRLHTSAGIELGDLQDIAPKLCADPYFSYTLWPGECLVWAIEPAANASDPPTDNWIFNLVWTEETLPTKKVSGNVTLSGAAYSGANVAVLVADDYYMTNVYLHSIQTTGAAGTWSANVPNTKIAFAYAQSANAGTYYTANGDPYINQ